jgi:hypothetical protein
VWHAWEWKRPLAPRAKKTDKPKVIPGVWKQGEIRGKSEVAGIDSDLSRIGATVKKFLPTTAGRRKNLK